MEDSPLDSRITGKATGLIQCSEFRNFTPFTLLGKKPAMFERLPYFSLVRRKTAHRARKYVLSLIAKDHDPCIDSTSNA
jgi:hypothetical protein